MWYSSLMRTLLISTAALLLPSLGLTTGPFNYEPRQLQSHFTNQRRFYLASLNETEDPRNELCNGSTASPNETVNSRNGLSNGSTASPNETVNPRNGLSNGSTASPNETVNPRNGLSNGSTASPNETVNPRNGLSNGSTASPNETVNPRNGLSNGSTASPNETVNPRNGLSNGSTASPNETVNPRNGLSNGSTASPNETVNPRNGLSNGSTASPNETVNPRNGLSNGSTASPNETVKPRNELSSGSKASSIDPEKDSFPRTSPFPDRRLYPGQNQQFRLPSDSEIARLLNEYREFVKKYPKGKLREANNNQSVEYGVAPRVSDTQPFYMGQRGPIHHNPTWKPNQSGIKRQGREKATEKVTGVTASGTPPKADYMGDMGIGATEMATEEYPGPGGAGGGGGGAGRPGKGGTEVPAPMTTQNEAQGAASRFTTKITTTKRRRRTTPSRVSFNEDCDYVAYYCLRAYDTGKVCGRTLFFVRMTFRNYCMIDYVNCMERYDIWQIAHMGECFEPKILTEYIHYPYLDDYFLDNYYVVEDM